MKPLFNQCFVAPSVGNMNNCPDHRRLSVLDILNILLYDVLTPAPLFQRLHKSSRIHPK